MRFPPEKKDNKNETIAKIGRAMIVTALDGCGAASLWLFLCVHINAKRKL